MLGLFFSYGCKGETALGQPTADLCATPYGGDGQGKAYRQISAMLLV